MHHILGFSQVLVEERAGLAFSHPVEVGYVDKLVVKTEASVGGLVVWTIEVASVIDGRGSRTLAVGL